MHVCVGGEVNPMELVKKDNIASYEVEQIMQNYSYANEILVVGQKQRHIVPLLQSVNKGV